MNRPRPELEHVSRTCPLCEAHCGVQIGVDRRRGEVVTVRGDEADPFSRGFLCPKAYGLKGLHEDPDRLRRPQIREGTVWREAGWEEALERVASKLRDLREAHGADALGVYLGNPNAHDMGSVLYGPSLLRALGTRWRFSATSVDQLPKMVSSCLVFGAPGSFAVPDVDRTGYFLVLGANPLASNGSLMTAPDMPERLRALRARGGRLVVVDPRRSETARIADRHLFIRPGADAFFLFSLLQVLFAEGLAAPGPLAEHLNGLDAVRDLSREFPPEAVEAVTGIAPGAVREVAREFAAAPAAVCYGRIGTCTQEFGSLASWLVDVVNAVTGNLDRPGGAMFPRSATGPAEDRPRRKGRIPYARWKSRVRGLPEFAGELPAAALAEEIDTPGEGRVRALLTVAGNPVLSTPNGARLARALSGLDFMVSVDIYRNETTRFAHVILPPESPLERTNCDLAFHNLSVRNVVHYSERVFEPAPGGMAQWRLLCEIAGRVNGASAETVDGLVLDGLLEATVGAPGTACPGLSREEARKRLGDTPGPDRLLDLLLRAGPNGDRFDDGREGLSLAKLRQHPHGLDLGPLEPRLPGVLQTASSKVELAPALLVSDVERLRAALDARRRSPGLVLIGRRHLRSNNSWLHNVEALAKGPERCTLLVHPDDAARLGLASGAEARIRSRVGEVVAPVALSDEMMPGVVSLPHGYGHGAEGAALQVASRHAGVSSNDLADETLLDVLSGNAVLNGIPVEVVAA